MDIAFKVICSNIAPFVSVAVTGLSPATGAALDISEIIQYIVHLKSSSVSQLNKGKSKSLQKSFKCFNGTTTSASSKLLSSGVLHIFFNLLVIVLLLFII